MCRGGLQGSPTRLTWHPGDDVVRGFTPSYFMKQLAIQAALEVLDLEQTPRELDIQLDVMPRE